MSNKKRNADENASALPEQQSFCDVWLPLVSYLRADALAEAAREAERLEELIAAVSQTSPEKLADLMCHNPAFTEQFHYAMFEALELSYEVHGKPANVDASPASPTNEQERIADNPPALSAEQQTRIEERARHYSVSAWAGPGGNDGKVMEKLGISRSTFYAWRKSGQIIGLDRGHGKVFYPFGQFLESKPIEGIKEVLAAAPDPRSAWSWLRQKNTNFNGKTPLATLLAGLQEQVRHVASQYFA